METKFQQSWQLFKASIAVTLRNRRLLWFPILTTFLTALLALFFLAPIVLPIVLHPTGYHLNQKEHWVALEQYYHLHHAFAPRAHNPAPDLRHMLFDSPAFHAGRGFSWGSLYWLLLYFVSMFLATFFNVAFYSQIIAALNGREVSFRRGLAVARSRLPSILAWTLLAGAVGWIIRSIEERLPFVARLVTGFIGIAWSVAAVFAIPVIIQEQPMRNPIKILKQSSLTLKRTWGEGLIGYIGFSAGNMVLFAWWLISLVLAGLVAFAFSSIWLMVIAGVIWGIGLFFMGYVSNVASRVYRCALYIYAAEGVVPEPYSQNLLDMAWKVKKS